MKIFNYAIACSLLIASNSFAAPVPADKTAYIGNWQGKDMTLSMAADGKIAYKRVYSTTKNVNLSIDLLSFNGDNFDAGYGIFRSTFVVSKPPARVGQQVKMVVDGVELTKVD